MQQIDETQVAAWLVRYAPDAIIFADRDGLICIWNEAAERLFGYRSAEVVGSSLDLIIPERLRSAHWAGFRKAIETGQTKLAGRAVTTRAVDRDGGKLYVDVSFSLVHDPAGAIVGALAIARSAPAPRGTPAS